MKEHVRDGLLLSQRIKKKRDWTFVVARFYYTAGLQFPVSSQQGLLVRYDFSLWGNVLKFADKQPKDARQEFLAILEDKLVARTTLQEALNG